MRTSFGALIVVFLAAAATGCVSAPKWIEGISVPAPSGPVKDKMLIVSSFKASERLVSITGNANIETIMESATVSDISPEVANGFVQAGLRAEARNQFDPARLQKGQLMVRGAILAHEKYQAGYGVWAVPYFLSIGLFGLWAPSPFTFEEGYKFVYRIDVIDKDGRYVLSTGTRDARIAHLLRHVAVEGDSRELFREMQRRVIEVAAEALSKEQPSSFGPD